MRQRAATSIEKGTVCAVMRRLFNMLVNNVREHFMIYLALWLLLAIIDLVWLWFF